MDVSIAIGIAALVGVAAITPGPNNVAVMAAAARRGFMGALPAIAAVVLGSLVMVLLTMAGLGAVLAAAPLMGVLLSIAGSAYLGYLGLRMFASARTLAPVSQIAAARGANARNRPAGPGGVRSDFASLFVFQFLNPKGWTMVLTAVATAEAAGHTLAGAASIAAIFLVVPAAGLSLWALSGALLSRRLEQPQFRRRFDRLMGVTLMACALLLLADAWQVGGAMISRGVWQ